MKIYTYKCCGLLEERWREAGHPKCAKCDKLMERTITSANFLFKGGRRYEEEDK